MSLVRNSSNPKNIFSPSLKRYLDYDQANKQFVLKDTLQDEKYSVLLPKSVVFDSQRKMNDEQLQEEFSKRFMFISDTEFRMLSFDDGIDGIWEIYTDLV